MPSQTLPEDIVRDFLDDLELLSIAHPELGDTDSREHLHEVIRHRYVERNEAYVTPENLSPNPIAEKLTRKFADQLHAWATSKGIISPEDRMATLREAETASSSGESMLDDFVQGWA